MIPAPHVDLPSRDDLRRAIRPWWSGGGTAEKIVDVLRRCGANLDEARGLAERMTKVAERLQYLPDEIIEEQLEMYRAAQASKEHAVGTHTESANPPIGSPEWLRRAEERARMNEAHYAQWGGYSAAVAKWKDLHKDDFPRNKR